MSPRADPTAPARRRPGCAALLALGAWLLGGAMVAATPYPWYALPVAALAAGGGAGWAWALIGAAFQIAYLSALLDAGPPADAVRVLAGGLVIWLALVARDHGWARRAVREQP